jgi:hypothetical protein
MYTSELEALQSIQETYITMNELSTATLKSYKDKVHNTSGNDDRKAGSDMAFSKMVSHGDPKVQSSEIISKAKSEIKGLIDPKHHSKYPIDKITGNESARKIYKQAHSAGHLKEDVMDESTHDLSNVKTDTLTSLHALHAKEPKGTRSYDQRQRVAAELKKRGIKVQEDVMDEKFAHPNHKKLDANDNGKVDAQDFALLRKKKGMKNFKEFKESLEQLDELSKKTLGSYVKKASAESNFASKVAGSASAGEYSKDAIAKEKEHLALAKKRRTGINKAVDKLTKEDLED